MKIDIFSDPICPWCYIGKKAMDLAIMEKLKTDPDWTPPTIKYFPYQLNPSMPVQGMDRQTYLSTKFGSAEQAQQIYSRIAAAGQKIGIQFQFNKISVTPNSLKAHSLLLWAQNDSLPKSKAGDASLLMQKIFEAYFEQGKDIGQIDCLTDLAVAAGYDRNEVIPVLSETQFQTDILSFDSMARQMGIQGVPCFIFNNQHASSGALPVDAFLDIFNQETNSVPDSQDYCDTETEQP